MSQGGVTARAKRVGVLVPPFERKGEGLTFVCVVPTQGWGGKGSHGLVGVREHDGEHGGGTWRGSSQLTFGAVDTP